NQIQLRLQLAHDLKTVIGNRVELEQVLLNLVLNGIEAMNGITDRTRELTIASHNEGGEAVVVQVTDTGTGIDPDYQQRIFENFVTTKPNGLGMGLSISRTIIETHGGRLRAQANQPFGATFEFNLPAA